jgi:hypothetical protein
MADGQTPQQQPNEDAVIATIQNQGNRVEQPTQLPENFNPEQFNQTLKQVAGVESYEQISELRQKADRLSEVQQQMNEIQRKYAELEGKSQLSPYANEFVQQIDSFFREGRQEGEIRKYLELHTKDVTSMQPMDAIVQKMIMENPGIGEADARLLVESEYEPGTTLGPEATEAEKARHQKEKARLEAKMKVEGGQAKKWLADQMKGFDSPEVKQKREEAQRRQQDMVQRWSKVANVLVDPKAFDDGIKLDFSLDDDKIGGKYEHPGFEPKLTPEIQQQLSGLIVQYAMENNIPLSDEYVPQLMEYRNAVLRNYFFDDFIKSVLVDYHAEISKALLQQFSNSGRPQNAPQREMQTQQPRQQQGPKAPQPGDLFF